MKFITRLLAIATLATALTPCTALLAEKKSSKDCVAGIAKIAIGAGLISAACSNINPYYNCSPYSGAKGFFACMTVWAAFCGFLSVISGLDDLSLLETVPSGQSNVYWGQAPYNITTGAANVYYGYPTHNYTIYTPVTYTHLPEVYIDYPEVIIL